MSTHNLVASMRLSAETVEVGTDHYDNADAGINLTIGEYDPQVDGETVYMTATEARLLIAALKAAIEDVEGDG